MILGRFSLRAAAMLLALAVGVGASSAESQTAQGIDSVYTLAGIPVDVTAEAAVQAREQALMEGQVEAFRRLLRRLTLLADVERLPRFEAKEVLPYVQGLSIANEKTSSVRYIAELTVQFKAQEVRDLLRDLNIEFSETKSKPVSVLPVYRDGSTLMLWEDSNLWRNSWLTISGSDGLVPLRHPLGDLADIVAIDPLGALAGDPDALAAIAANYEERDILVVSATRGVEQGSNMPYLDVSATRYGTTTGSEQTLSLRYFAQEGDSIAALLERTAKALAMEVEDAWKRRNLQRLDAGGVVFTLVPLNKLADWLDVRRRLERVAVINQIELVIMTKNEARINLHFQGGADQLMTALAQADLVLTPREDEWVLTPRGLPNP